MTRSRFLMILPALFLCLLAVSCGKKEKEDPNVVELNFGHFPNVTHVQGLVAHHFSRQGKGWFEERLKEATGKDVRINWYVYNAGPSAMEAVFARSIELAYVGPSPAINAFVRSRGEDIRMIAGAVEGGAALVVPKDSSLKEPADFRGKVIATPQLGNTQDVSARAWFSRGGLHVTQRGGDVTILPTPNPEQLSLFRQGKLDGVWTVEPWVSRLVLTAGGRVLVDEKESIATVLVCGAEFLREKPEVAKALVQAHEELNEWIRLHQGAGGADAFQNRPGIDCGGLEKHRHQGQDFHSQAPAVCAGRPSGRIYERGSGYRRPGGAGGGGGTVDHGEGGGRKMIAGAEHCGPGGCKLRIAGVSKVFDGRSGKVVALEGINLNIRGGEFVCLVGASGCGKTSLLNIIAGLEFPSSGVVELDGEPVTGPGRDRTVMFQESALFPWLDVMGNVMFGLNLVPGLTRGDRLAMAEKNLELVGLKECAHAHIHELSGGMKQRVALARALATSPRILLMDEPFAALDAMTREQLYQDIQEIHLRCGMTIVFVTHNMREAVCLGDRVVLLTPHPGRVCEEYFVDFPHPRDINSSDLAALSSRITRDLKGATA